jgi:hypothetical protein
MHYSDTTIVKQHNEILQNDAMTRQISIVRYDRWPRTNVSIMQCLHIVSVHFEIISALSKQQTPAQICVLHARVAVCARDHGNVQIITMTSADCMDHSNNVDKS